MSETAIVLNMSDKHFSTSPWLLSENFSRREIGRFAVKSPWAGVPSDGIGDAGKARILRFNIDDLKEHIKKWMKNKVTTGFQGIHELKAAAASGFLRKGQLIFEEVTWSHATATEGTFTGTIWDAFAPFLTLARLRQSRSFAYFHVAIYVGCYQGKHFVVENGGQDGTGFGTINASSLENAFSEDSKFFVVSPPKDESDKTTRYVVLQRALASVGVEYEYHMRAVSCETFAIILIGLRPDFHTIQQGILRSHKRNLSQEEAARLRDKDMGKYKIFYESLVENIGSVRKGVILTLDFLKKQSHGGTPSGKDYIERMTKAYTDLMDAVSMGDKQRVVTLVNQGLDLTCVTAYGKTALTIAASKDLPDICKALLSEVNQEYRSNGDLPDDNLRTALEYAHYYNHKDTVDMLLSLNASDHEKFEKEAKLARDNMRDYVPDLMELRPDDLRMHVSDLEKNPESLFGKNRLFQSLTSIPEMASYFYYEVSVGQRPNKRFDSDLEKDYPPTDIPDNRSTPGSLYVGFSMHNGIVPTINYQIIFKPTKNEESVMCGNKNFPSQYVSKNFFSKRFSKDVKNQFKDEVIGCGIDFISNVVAFTRNGKTILGPFHFPSPKQPQLPVHPQLQIYGPVLPTVCPQLQIDGPVLHWQILDNYGQKPFQFQGDLIGDLFNATPVALERGVVD